MHGASGTTIAIAVVAGVGLGSVYAMMALSFSVIVATTNLFHFALGSFIMLATILSYVFASDYGWPVWAVVLTVSALGLALGLASYGVGVLPLLKRARDANSSVLISTLAISLIITGVAQQRFGSDARPVKSYVSTTPLDIGTVPIRPVFIFMVALLIVLTVAFELTMRRTSVGRLLRVAEEDPVAVDLMGVRLRVVHLIVFGLAGLLAGLAGFIVAPVSYASPAVGTTLLLFGFAAMAIGGFGSVLGAVVGGIVVGLVTNLLPIFFTASLTNPALFVLLLVTLFLRPRGLFGAGAVREV